MKTRQTTWQWPDHNIGKRESRWLREEHNALANEHYEMLQSLQDLFKNCCMVHTYWGEMDNRVQADAAIARAKAAIAKAEGRAQ